MLLRTIHVATTVASLSLLFACQKKDVPVVQPPPPLDARDYQLRELTQRQVNEFSIVYDVTSPDLNALHDIRLYLSKNADFSKQDSVTLHEAVKGQQTGIYYFRRMAKFTTYHVRLGVTHSGYRYYSEPVTIQTDSIRFSNMPGNMSRGITTIFNTNYVLPPDITKDTSVHLYLNGKPHPTWVLGNNLASFQPDQSLTPGKYHIALEGNGIRSEAPDSIELLGGKWSTVSGPANQTNGLYAFGACQSTGKGYVIPGINRYEDTSYLNHLFIFDPATESWTSETTTHSPYFQSPVCFYRSNSIYVVGGQTVHFDGFNMVYEPLKNMYRLDLATMDWSMLAPLPEPRNRLFTQAFQLDDLIYLGLGEKYISGQNDSLANDFWKYSTTSEQWTKLADMPRTHLGNQQYPTTFTTGGKGYVFYGDIPPFGGRELWAYVPETDSWSLTALQPDATPEPGEKYLVVIQNGEPCFLTSQQAYHSSSIDWGKHIQIDLATGKYKLLSRNPRETYTTLIFSSGSLHYALESGPDGKLQKFEYE